MELLLGHNIVSKMKGIASTEISALQSAISGLQILDRDEVNNENSGELSTLDSISTIDHRVIGKRCEMFEIKSMDSEKSSSACFDPGFSVSSDYALVENLKEMLEFSDSSKLKSRTKRNLSEDNFLEHEVAEKKVKKKNLSELCEALESYSLSVKDPISGLDDDLMSGSGSVNFVSGDCTNPSKNCPLEPTVIFSCIDDSGHWGRGGMFDALAKLSMSIPDAYQRASKFGDLHLGDVHLVKINEDHDEKRLEAKTPQMVALAVAQSYNPWRKVPRSNISIPDLENCLMKTSSFAAQISASIHMPRIGHQSRIDSSEWHIVERLLRKCASRYGVNIFVYYFRHSS